MPGSPRALSASWIPRWWGNLCLTWCWHPTFLLGWKSPVLKAWVQFSQRASTEEDTPVSASCWLSPASVTREKGQVEKRGWRMRSQGTAAFPGGRGGRPAARSCAVTGRKKTEIWAAARGCWPFAPRSGVPGEGRKPVGWMEGKIILSFKKNKTFQQPVL